MSTDDTTVLSRVVGHLEPGADQAQGDLSIDPAMKKGLNQSSELLDQEPEAPNKTFVVQQYLLERVEGFRRLQELREKVSECCPRKRTPLVLGRC